MCADLVMRVALSLERQPGPFCQDSSVQLRVKDVVSLATIPGSTVIITFQVIFVCLIVPLTNAHQGREIVRSSTGEGGVLEWEVGANGNYFVTAGKVGYFNSTRMYSLACSLNNCEVLYFKIFTDVH